MVDFGQNFRKIALEKNSNNFISSKMVKLDQKRGWFKYEDPRGEFVPHFAL